MEVKMKIKTLKQKGKITTGIIITITLISITIFNNLFSKKPLIEDKISLKDTNQLIAVYLDDGTGTYNKASDSKIPTSGYTLNTDTNNTRCTVNGEIDSNVIITYENGEIKVSKVTKPGTKCYFYFDKIKDTESPVIGLHEARNIEKTSLDLYAEATDNMSIAGYYFKLNTSSEWSEEKCAGQNSCTHSVTNLSDNTSYTFDIKVCDEAGNCPTTTITTKTKANGIPTPDIIPDGKPTDDSMFAGTNGDGVYTWTKSDYSGGSEPIKYFRGNVDNNWVVFGKDGTKYIWWRIIRNNSNGSLRMLYAGTSNSKTSTPSPSEGVNPVIKLGGFSTTALYESTYVGFKYTKGQLHGTQTESYILKELNTWYNKTLGANPEYSEKLDLDAGFCNDRSPFSGTGEGVTTTYFLAYNRLYTNKTPSLLCAHSNDVFKTPTGLITADEASMAGMVADTNKKNTTSYIYITVTVYGP